MTDIVYTPLPNFTAQKGRKRLFQVPITVTVHGSVANAPWVVRVSSLTVGGVFLIQAMPPSWTDQTPPALAPAPPPPTTIVQSPVFTPTTDGQVFPFTAFPTFLDNIAPLSAPANNQAGTYQVDVVNAAGGLVATTQFTITGDASPVQPVNVVFVLDHGQSMTTSVVLPDRLGRLKAAFARGIRLLRDSDGLGVASFANDGWLDNPSLPLLGATQLQQDNANKLATALTPDESGSTRKHIQSGIDAGRFVSPSIATLVLVTDGENHNNPRLTSPTLPTSALIIGEDPALVPTSAARMVSASGAFLYATSQTLGEFAIEKLLTQILIGIGGSAFVSDPEGSLAPGEQQTFPLHVTEADRELEVIVFSNNAMVLKVTFEDLPDSEPRDDCEEPPVEEPIRKDGVLIQRLALRPLARPNRTQRPKVTISRPDRKSCADAPVRFNLLVVAKTDLMLDTQVTASGLTVGSDLLFSAVLHEYGLTWHRNGVSVHVELTHPDGFMQLVPLQECEGAPGRFQATLRAFRVGAYTAHFVATGKSLLHHRIFRRESLRTVAVFPPSDCCPADDPCASSYYSRT